MRSQSRLMVLLTAAIVLVAATGQSASGLCRGDCDGSGDVTVDEIILGVGIALGTAAVEQCPSFDADVNGAVTVDELLAAVNDALNGCVPAGGSVGQPLKTGQTTCYDVSGIVIPCAGTGQDGELQTGLSPAYVDNGDGTITDIGTGLTWEKLSDDSSIHDKDTVYTLADAFTTKIASLNSAGFAGYNDWRLPNINELQSLVRYEAVNPGVSPAVNAAFNTSCTRSCTVTTCSCTHLADYWSSTTDQLNPSFAWGVLFLDGTLRYYGKSHSGCGYVRAVRGLPAAQQGQRLKTGQTTCYDGVGAVIACAGTGQDGELQAGLSPSYVDNGDGTISDTRTGLMWEKLSYDRSIHDRSNVYTWTDAFSTKIASLNSARFAGYNDWRLPNVNELQSLVSYGAMNPAVSAAFNTSCAPGCTVTACSCTPSSVHWSSTTYLLIPAAAWYVGFFDGSGFNFFKSDRDAVRAVRGGS